MIINVNRVWFCPFLVFCDLTWFLINSVPHHSVHIIRLVGHRHEPVFSFPHAEHCGRRMQVMSRLCPAPGPAPPLPSQHPAASTETHWHTDGPEQAANSTRLSTASTSLLIPIGHSQLLHFVNWSCLLSLAVTPGNRLHVRVECNLWNQSLRFIHPERIRRHFSLRSLQTPPLTASAQQGRNLDAVVNQLYVPLWEHGKKIIQILR